MNRHVLVTYGSRLGSTAEIAAAIATVLRDRGLDVTLEPAHRVHVVASYDAVVLGSPIYAGRWRPDAVQLLARERSALTHRRVWLFQVGLSVVGPSPDPSPTPKLIASLAAEIGAQGPASFAGCLTPETAIGLMPRLMARLSPARGDHRDWDAITAWAVQLADQLTGSPVR